jgi:copper chaperone CopZ
MKCEGCRRGVLSALGSVTGITNAQVSLEQGTANIAIDASADRSAITARAIQAISKAGFFATDTAERGACECSSSSMRQ